VVDDLSDFSKGQAFECFHCYKQVHNNNNNNNNNSLLCILFIRYFPLFLLPFFFIVFLYVCIFSFDATILVNKDVYIIWFYALQGRDRVNLPGDSAAGRAARRQAA